MRYLRVTVIVAIMILVVACTNDTSDQLVLTSHEEATSVDNWSKADAFITEEVFFEYQGDEVVNFGCRVIEEGNIIEDRDLFVNVKLNEINGVNMEAYSNIDSLTDIGILIDSDTLGGGATFPLQELFDISDGVIEMQETGKYDINDFVQLWSINSGNGKDNRIVIYLYKVES